jgi:hypothetical protein
MMAIHYLEEYIEPYSEPPQMVSEDAQDLIAQIHGKNVLQLQTDDQGHGRFAGTDGQAPSVRLHFEELGIPQEAWRNANGIVKWIGVYCAQAYTKSLLSMIYRA